jgi:hypothetical protein
MKVTSRNGKNMVYSELNDREIFAFLKCNIPSAMRLYNPKTNNYEFTVDLRDRVLDEGKQKVLAIVNKETKDPLYFNYSEILNLINPEWLLTFETTIFIYNDQKPLIDILGTIKSDIIDTCVNIHYINKEGVFGVINTPFTNGKPDKMYYWEENNDILYFGEAGPELIKDTDVLSIESLICD